MGNCCSSGEPSPKGSSAAKDNFAGQGRTLGSAAPALRQDENAKVAVPPQVAGRSNPVVVGPDGAGGRTMGGDHVASTADGNDARSAAARAAEARFNKKNESSTAQGAKLQANLDAQKKQTMNAALRQSAADNVAARDADALAEVRHYQ